jgi:ABC-2 type transport system ATP-binding protein
MLQRIAVAQALLNDPDLVFLDEPTAGLDPMGAIQMRGIITELRNRGKTVFLCSHLLKDMEPMCDQVGILSRGELKLTGRIDEVLEKGTGYRVRSANVSPELKQKTSAMGTQVSEEDGTLLLKAADQQKALEIAQVLSQGGADVIEVGHDRRTLEEVFLEVVEGESGD